MQNRLLKSVATFSLITAISRITGFLRDLTIAYVFGVSYGLDAFLLAFKIPNCMRRLFAEGAFSQAFIPVLSDYKQNNPKNLLGFIQAVFTALATFLLIIVLVGQFNSEFIIKIFAPGLDLKDIRFAQAVYMLKMTMPFIGFIALTAFAAAILNTFQKFALSAFTPVLLNLSLIIAAFTGAKYFKVPELSLAIAVPIAGVLQLGLLWWAVAKMDMLPRFAYDFAHPGLKRVINLMLPAMFAAAVSQINILLDTIFASFLPVGSITWLYFADRLMELPLGLIGVAISSVLLPELSKLRKINQISEFNQKLDWGLQWSSIIAIPATVGLFYLAKPICLVLFTHGDKFSHHDAIQSAMALKAYAPAILGIIITKILLNGFYAKENTSLPVKVAIMTLLVNCGLNLYWINSYKHVGLAMATSIAAILQATVLWIVLKYKYSYKSEVAWYRFYFIVLLVSGLMLYVLCSLNPEFETWLTMKPKSRLGLLFKIIMSGMVTYVIVLYIAAKKLKNITILNRG